APIGRRAGRGDPKAGSRPAPACSVDWDTCSRGVAARSHSTMADRIAVLGAGQMGNGIAHVFAQSGFSVTMIDIDDSALQKGRGTIASNLDRQIKKGTLQAAEKDAILGRVATSTSMGDGVKGASLVIEAATENKDLKFRIFTDLDRLAEAGAILATNTRSI